jgi:hypothetical protein
MAIRYYDHTLARHRIKNRYKWAAWAFLAGMLAGMVFAWMI